MLIFESNFPDDFRNEEIEKILEYAITGKFCQLVCIPGAGKATILRLLAHNRSLLRFHLKEKEKSIQFVYLNLLELSNFDEAQIFKFLLLALNIKPKIEDSLALSKQLTESINSLTQEKNLIFLFDHFDEYQNRLPRTFFQMLKSARNLAKYKFACVFATRRDLAALVDQEIAKDYWDFFVGNTIYLKIGNTQATSYLFTQIEKALNKKLTNVQKSQIATLTGGHAKLTKVITEQAIRQNLETKSELLLKNAEVRAVLFEIWLFLTSEEQHHLHMLAGGSKPSTISEFLINSNLISEPTEFTIPLFQDFVKTVPLSESNETIVFDEKTREILKGKSVISELLSSQEFKLIKFLLQNPSRVIERNEIIQAVWPESKITEAISDEAIDQMVFRLRKKIEDIPASPKHLLTVKGRGIKFEP